MDILINLVSLKISVCLSLARDKNTIWFKGSVSYEARYFNFFGNLKRE